MYDILSNLSSQSWFVLIGMAQVSGVKVGDVLLKYDNKDLKALKHKEVLELIASSPSPSALMFIDPLVYYQSLSNTGLGISIACPLHMEELHVRVTKEIGTFSRDHKIDITFSMPDAKSPQQPQRLFAEGGATSKWENIPSLTFSTRRNLEAASITSSSHVLGILTLKLTNKKGEVLSTQTIEVTRAMDVVDFILLPSTVVNNESMAYITTAAHSATCTDLLLQRIMKEHKAANDKLPAPLPLLVLISICCGCI